MQCWDAADTGGRRRGHRDDKLKLSLLQTIRISAAENIVWGRLYVWFKKKGKKKKEFSKKIWNGQRLPFAIPLMFSLSLHVFPSYCTVYFQSALLGPGRGTCLVRKTQRRVKTGAALVHVGRVGWGGVSHSQTTWGQTETWGPWVS